MLSASHNPMPDNGIKFFARGGNKLDDALEDAIEARMRRAVGPADRRRRRPGQRGRLAGRDYVAHLVNSLGQPVSLRGPQGRHRLRQRRGLRLAGPAAFEAQGAEVIRIHAEPDGININDNCGSTHMDSLRAAVVEHGADLGHRARRRRRPLPGRGRRRARSSTATRSWPSWRCRMRESGRLKNDTVVATVMSNLGFVQAMQTAGITVEQTRVGDRYVLEAMKAGGFTLGGEQSGHVVMLDHATTGDGVLTAPAPDEPDGHHRTEPGRPGRGDGAGCRRC